MYQKKIMLDNITKPVLKKDFFYETYSTNIAITSIPEILLKALSFTNSSIIVKTYA